MLFVLDFKPHIHPPLVGVLDPTAVEVRNLAPLELVHWDLCEINGVLTKGGKKYFMTLIDDPTRYCYVYLLKSKDVAFHFLKV